MLLTATPPTTTKPSFPDLLDEAMRHRGAGVQSKQYALDHGVDETALIRYANGAVSTYERREIEHVLSRCDWARNFVVNFVKSKRKERHRSAA